MKSCLRESCKKLFEPNKPKQKFCSDICRVNYHRDKSKKVQEERKADPLWEEFLNWKKEKETSTEHEKYKKKTSSDDHKKEHLTDIKETNKLRPLTLAERISAIENAEKRI